MTDGQRGGEPPGLDDRDPCTLDEAFLEIEKLQRKAGNLNQMVEDLRDKDDILTGAVAALRAEVDAMTARHLQAIQSRVWWWPDLTADEARNAWETLTKWMQDVLLVRYPEADHVLQPCWYRHPAAVDALTSLYTTWRAAYQDPTAQPAASASWLNQWLPAALDQIKQALRSCDWTVHRDDTARRQNSGRLFGNDLASFIAADVVSRGDAPG
jgi:hypothetical protein